MTDTTPTTHKPQSDMISRPMARLLVGFIAIVLLLVGYASFTGRPPSAVVSDGKIVQNTALSWRPSLAVLCVSMI